MLCATELIRAAERRPPPVNAYAAMYMNDHLQSLHAEARERRLASLVGKRSLRDRIASAATSLRRTVGTDSTGSIVPTLRNYPFEG
jgi:hypothetical protein